MSPNFIIAVCAVIIALGSFFVAFKQARAIRDHNRRSVQPILRIRHRDGIENSEAGIILVNHGLGPAFIANSVVTYKGTSIGPWTQQAYAHLLDRNEKFGIERPKYVTLIPEHTVIASNQEIYLLRMDGFDRQQHSWFWDLITVDLKFEIHYESIYGQEGFIVIR
ncbi:hypothetical protein [Actinomadura sp. GTD37]|uniref:hypothetical protein n=1 Tax=Actinomadura sp. GTD37 TaxID=1778030 RepID=UPI0035C07E18